MITDKERREVAAKLRERTKEPLGKNMQRMFSDTLGIYTPNNGWRNPEKATAHWTVIVDYLADLIDRPTCRNTVEDSGICGTDFRCSHCELAWSFDVGDLEDNDFNYCPKCGREIEQ